MTRLIKTVVAGAFAIGFVSVAHAQSAQVPNPTNPFPAYPIATDGTPLPSQANNGPINGYDNGTGLFAGRSASVGGPVGFIGDVVGAGVNTAGAAVGAGVGVPGSVVGDGFGAVGIR